MRPGPPAQETPVADNYASSLAPVPEECALSYPLRPQAAGHAPARIRLALAVLLAAVAVFIQAGWFVVVFSSPDPQETALRDWIQFHRTAERVVAGRASEIYPVTFEDDGRPEFSDGFFFLYPPFAAWATLPLAGLSPLGAYVACALFVAAVTLVAVLMMLGGLRTGPPARVFALLGTAASAPWNTGVILGHLSATLLAAPSLSLVAWARGWPGWSGAALGILLAKPNWGIPVLVLLVAARRWRMVGGFLLAGAALVAVS
ncbi:MAG TPA: glycosyltransferase family 87 protein, partial [Longimicrobiales bacterium]|nr:glycosyltransferase family 87 protein [Longimicrobiales bacterium]